MAEVTVADFAKVLKVPVDRLIEQLDEAGIKVGGPNDVISEDAKLELLTHLKNAEEQSVREAREQREAAERERLAAEQREAEERKRLEDEQRRAAAADQA